MANVYLARDMILEREVALKILRMDFSNDDEFIKRFNREAQAATSLAHQNIVSIYDVGIEDDIYYIVMEYVDGLTLKQYIQRNFPIPVDKALDIMEQIASAISHAHQYGIIHRDIKPQNILIDGQGQVKITDFGIAMALSATNITQTNAVLGSVHYLSPEQARGGMANKTSDIYSMGIVMFELLTGRLPFSGESAISIALKHLQSEMPSPKRWNPDIPQSVANCVLKATSKDPFYRYASSEEMAEDLKTGLDPGRRNEAPFVLPEDKDATKAIPIIPKDIKAAEFDETLIRGAEPAVVQKGKPAKDKKKKKPVKAKKRKRWPMILVSTFLFLLLLSALSFTVLPDMTAPKEVKIPDIKNKKLDNAMTSMLDHGFKIGKTMELEDDEVQMNSVIKTDPEIGSVVKEGTTVDIYISSGKKKITLSDFMGANIDDIQTIVKSQGFNEPEITKENDDSVAGTILQQDPAPNAEVVPSDTQLKFTVSLGPEKITLKDLKEFNQQNLDEYSSNNGLVINTKSEEYSDTVPKGFVISQDPAPSTQLEKGSTVNVVISKGKKELPPKTVPVDVNIPYDQSAGGKEQMIRIYVEDMENSLSEPFSQFRITAAEKRTINLIIAPGKKAEYKVERDNEVIQDETVSYPE